MQLIFNIFKVILKLIITVIPTYYIKIKHTYINIPTAQLHFNFKLIIKDYIFE